jgi:hypothetical protein
MNTQLEFECRTTIAQHLKAITSQLVAGLSSIIGRDAPSDAAALRFEYESPHFDDGFPVMFWFVLNSGQTGAIQKLLPMLGHTIPEAVVYDARFEAAGLDTWSIASEVFLSWFADCWRDAGGHKFSCPAYLAHHDSIYSFDLTRRIEVTEAP